MTNCVVASPRSAFENDGKGVRVFPIDCVLESSALIGYCRYMYYCKLEYIMMRPSKHDEHERTNTGNSRRV